MLAPLPYNGRLPANACRYDLPLLLPSPWYPARVPSSLSTHSQGAGGTWIPRPWRDLSARFS
eukprot:6135373-Pyramimonas_sp.AAC.1